MSLIIGALKISWKNFVKSLRMGSSFWVWRGGYVACAFQEELNARFLKTSSSKTGPRCPYRKIKFY